MGFGFIDFVMEIAFVLIQCLLGLKLPLTLHTPKPNPTILPMHKHMPTQMRSPLKQFPTTLKLTPKFPNLLMFFPNMPNSMRFSCKMESALGAVAVQGDLGIYEDFFVDFV